MNRKAIIIGSNYDSTLSGVKADIVEWKKFLLSPIGGAWNPDELIILKDARTVDEVITAIKSAENTDYAFIAFSGHGGIYKREQNWLGILETFICLDKNEILSEYYLNPGPSCKRCTILLDCCRTSMPDVNKFIKIAFAQENCDDELKKCYRNLFDKQLDLSDMGCVKIYATGIGYGAEDENSFSRNLIESAKLHMKSNQCSTLYLNDAVYIASEAMTDINPQQIPQYVGGRRNRHFPFAVNPLIFG